MFDKLMKKAIDNKLIVNLTFKSKEKGIITRACVPFDIGPSKRYKSNKTYFHFYDLESPDGHHNLSIEPIYIRDLIITKTSFNPADFVTWKNISWYYPRDWDIYS